MTHKCIRQTKLSVWKSDKWSVNCCAFPKNTGLGRMSLNSQDRTLNTSEMLIQMFQRSVSRNIKSESWFTAWSCGGYRKLAKVNEMWHEFWDAPLQNITVKPGVEWWICAARHQQSFFENQESYVSFCYRSDGWECGRLQPNATTSLTWIFTAARLEERNWVKWLCTPINLFDVDYRIEQSAEKTQHVI